MYHASEDDKAGHRFLLPKALGQERSPEAREGLGEELARDEVVRVQDEQVPVAVNDAASALVKGPDDVEIVAHLDVRVDPVIAQNDKGLALGAVLEDPQDALANGLRFRVRLKHEVPVVLDTRPVLDKTTNARWRRWHCGGTVKVGEEGVNVTVLHPPGR